jgi:photosynthetic reaction center H subunit
MSTDEKLPQRLQALDGSDFEIADGQPNIQGWIIYDIENEEIGEIQDLIFDTHTNSVRYLVVDLEGNAYGIEDKKILLPIGIAEIKEEDKEIRLPKVMVEELRDLPSYHNELVTLETEQRIREVFEGSSNELLNDESGFDSKVFYSHDHFNQDRFYKRHKPLSKEEEIASLNLELERIGAVIVPKMSKKPSQDEHNQDGNNAGTASEDKDRNDIF